MEVRERKRKREREGKGKERRGCGLPALRGYIITKKTNNNKIK